MPINGEQYPEPQPEVLFIYDLAFGALQGIALEFAEDEENANKLMEGMIKNAWERLGDAMYEE